MSEASLNTRVRDAAAMPVKRAILYLRVSSKRQMDTDADLDPDGNSIDTQRKVCHEKARQAGMVIIDEYVEPGNSAQTIAKRPVFREMMQRINEQRDVDCVIIYMRSRAFRNYVDAGNTKLALQKLGVKLVSAKEDFGEGIMAEAMEAVTDVFNWLQVRMSGEDIKIKMANKARNGGTIGRAKVGYLNQKKLIDGRKVNTIALDPDRAHYIPMAFELFATGQETVTSLRDKLISAGFRMPATAKKPSAPISIERLRLLLRDRYYLGYVTYETIEYKGRHEPLISEELFDRVQRILDSHSGSGARHRSHNHYLKGVLWCGRCKYRLIVQRAVGRQGGEYYYFFCRGRQEGVCDLPFMPVEVMEDAVAGYYGHAVTLPAEYLAQVRAGVDEAVSDHHELSDALREQYAKRLDALDRKESYFLDLAADEGWPKDKLRAKITGIRVERKDIEETLAQAEQHLDRGRAVFHDALALLEAPQAAYEHGDEAVRSILNKAFFTRLYVDGGKIVGHELNEPFDVLAQAYHVSTINRTGTTVAERQTYESAVPTAEYDALTRDSVTGSLALSSWGQGWSKPVMVGDTRIEPVTSSV